MACSRTFGASAVVVGWLLVGSAHAAECVYPDAVFQKGFTLGGWSRDDYASKDLPGQVRELKSAGVEWVALTPRWIQERVASIMLAAHPALSPSDESLRAAIRRARRQGLHVFLKPQVDILVGGWRGEITFSSESNWEAWFRSYRAFISHYARLAQEESVELFSVGVELDAARHREADWRNVVQSVRELFEGRLTYSANWGRERDITWWDALDYAGVDAYFPIGSGHDSSVEELRVAWEPHVQGLRAWAAKICRPVIFTEVGYRSVHGAGREPWEWQRPGKPSRLEQEHLYRAALASLWGQPWFFGFYWWQLQTSPPQDAANDTEYTPQGKPAFSVIKEFYARDPRCPTSGCS